MSIKNRTDVNISDPVHGQVLGYDAPNSYWTNQTQAAESSVTQPGFIKFDSFAGSTDDQKVTAMNDWAMNHGSQPRPAVLFSNRTYAISTPFKLFSGLRMIGGMQMPLQNFARGTVIDWQGGSGSSIFIFPPEGQTGQSYPSDGSPRDISVSYMQFQGPDNTDFLEQATNYTGKTLWYCEFHSCSWRNLRSVWRGYSTGSSISGQSYFEDINGTAINVGGAETSIFGQDTMSYVHQGIDPGVPFLQISLSKSAVGQCHFNVRGVSPALRIDGGHNTTYNGLVISPSDGSSINGAGIVITDGTAHTITNCHLTRVATNPSAGWNGSSSNQGWIQASGGYQHKLYGNTFIRQGSVPATDFPLIHVTNGVSSSGLKWGHNNYSGFSGAAWLSQATLGRIVKLTDPSVTFDGDTDEGEQPETGDPLHQQRIGIIGDSLTDMNSQGPTWLTNEMVARGWQSSDVRVDGLVGRGIAAPGAVPTPSPYSTDVIDTWRADGFDPRVWVFALGTNNSPDLESYWTSAIQSVIDKVMSGPADDYQIYWIGTGYGNSPTQDKVVEFQNKLDEFAGANSNFTALDYNAHLAGYRTNPSWDSWWSGTSGIHNTNSGYQTLRVPFFGASVEHEAPDGGGSEPGEGITVHTGAGNVTSGSAASGTSLTIDKPANTTDGDLLIAATWGRENTADYSGAPAGWTAMPSSPISTLVGVQRFYYKAITGTESPANYTWSGGGWGRHAGIIFRVTGANTADPFDAAGAYATGISVGTSHSRLTLPSVTASADSLLLAHLGSNTSGGVPESYPAPTGMTLVGSAGTNTGGGDSSISVVAQAISSSGATGSREFNSTTVHSSGAGYMITIK